MSAGQSKALVVETEIACGIVAGPLFVSSFAAIGARRAGYDWRRHAVSWACYSAGSAIAITTAFVLFGAAFGGAPRLAGKGGVFQRISITAGFAWMSALSLRTLSAVLLSRPRW